MSRLICLFLREIRSRWYGHIERSSDAVSTVACYCDIEVDGAGKPKMTWKK